MTFDLNGYEDVATRLERFHQLYPDGRITVQRPELLQLPDDTWRVLVSATVWRTTDDPCPVTDWSAEPYPGRTPYTRGSEVENASTSAIGRALRLALPGQHTATRSEVAARVSPVPAGPARTAQEYADDAAQAPDLAALRKVWTAATDAGVLDNTVNGDITLKDWLTAHAADMADNAVTDSDGAA